MSFSLKASLGQCQSRCLPSQILDSSLIWARIPDGAWVLVIFASALLTKWSPWAFHTSLVNEQKAVAIANSGREVRISGMASNSHSLGPNSSGNHNSCMWTRAPCVTFVTKIFCILSQVYVGPSVPEIAVRSATGPVSYVTSNTDTHNTPHPESLILKPPPSSESCPDQGFTLPIVALTENFTHSIRVQTYTLGHVRQVSWHLHKLADSCSQHPVHRHTEAPDKLPLVVSPHPQLPTASGYALLKQDNIHTTAREDRFFPQNTHWYLEMCVAVTLWGKCVPGIECLWALVLLSILQCTRRHQHRNILTRMAKRSHWEIWMWSAHVTWHWVPAFYSNPSILIHPEISQGGRQNPKQRLCETEPLEWGHGFPSSSLFFKWFFFK